MAIAKSDQDKNVEVNFESHPPIEDDLDGITALLRQTLIQFVDCQALARYLIELKDITQVIALEVTEEETNTDEDDDEPDNDIYGVTSVIDLDASQGTEVEARKQLVKFLKDKCPEAKKLFDQSADDGKRKLGLIINERYINLPPQLAVPTLKSLTQHLEESHYTHLIFISKILVNPKADKPPKKKAKSGMTSTQHSEPLIYVNPEEEIVWENSEHSTDFDVSQSDDSSTWSFDGDIKYTTKRRIMIINHEKWSYLLKDLEKEL